MEILINQGSRGEIHEDYSEFDNDEDVGVFGEVCRSIDNLNIASFSVLFKKWDPRFDHTDFAYDFTSIGTEISGLVHYLENPTKDYSLGFYELDRKGKF